MEKNVLVGGMRLDTHDKGSCKGEYCTIHNFSDHHMVKWNQNWRGDRQIMERICGHGIGHIDPDEVEGVAKDSYLLNHGCDGCCNPSSQFNKDLRELTKQYVEPDYLTPTSVGPVSTGTRIDVTPEPIPGTLESLEKLISSIRKPSHKGIDA
jgi:hypothetical protein